jgi:hypothetical protein
MKVFFANAKLKNKVKQYEKKKISGVIACRNPYPYPCHYDCV